MTEQQLALPLANFKGSTFDERRDGKRLAAQLERVRAAMRSGEWLTLAQLSAMTGAPEASVSARLRDCRRLGHTIERRFVGNGLHMYRLKPPSATDRAK